MITFEPLTIVMYSSNSIEEAETVLILFYALCHAKEFMIVNTKLLKELIAIYVWFGQLITTNCEFMVIWQFDFW